MKCARPGVLSGGRAHNSAGIKSVIAVPHPLLPTQRNRLLYSGQPQTEGIGRTYLCAYNPVRRMEFGGLFVRGQSVTTWGYGIFENLRCCWVFCFGVFLEAQGFRN